MRGNVELLRRTYCMGMLNSLGENVLHGNAQLIKRKLIRRKLIAWDFNLLRRKT